MLGKGLVQDGWLPLCELMEFLQAKLGLMVWTLKAACGGAESGDDGENCPCVPVGLPGIHFKLQ